MATLENSSPKPRQHYYGRHRPLHTPTTKKQPNHHNNSCNRQFSSTTRRRRRGVRSAAVEEPQTTNPTNTAGSLSNEQFQAAAQQLFAKIETSIDKLKECNDGLEIERLGPKVDNTNYSDEDETNHSHEGQMLIHIPAYGDTFWGGGTYKLTIHSEPIEGVDRLYNGYVSMQSPLSGTFNYIFNVRTGDWEGTEDSHALLGMFTRDFIRQCQGVPDF